MQGDKIRALFTVAENACVHNTQNRAICAGNIENCCFTDPIMVQALRYPARKEGAYWLLIGSSGLLEMAWAKKQRCM
jgi:hypothetical protein